MGYDVAACGMIGIILSQDEGRVNTQFIPDELDARMRKALMEPEQETGETEEAYEQQRVWDWQEHVGMYDYMLEPFIDEVEAALRYRGIMPVPGGFLSYRDGSDDAGRCDTEPYTILYGLGIFTKPWDFPVVDQSFKNVADIHTWVTGG